MSRLIEELKRQEAQETSYFRQHLLKEDVARLERLENMAATCTDVAAFISAGKEVGWTAEAHRTHELSGTLEPLLAAVFTKFQTASSSPGDTVRDEEILALWQAFETDRMERLVGCLSRVPRPSDVSK